MIVKKGVEIVGTNVEAPFWDIPYEVQKKRIIDMTKNIEACTGIPVKIISSR